jgi:hypothetical protein
MLCKPFASFAACDSVVCREDHFVKLIFLLRYRWRRYKRLCNPARLLDAFHVPESPGSQIIETPSLLVWVLSTYSQEIHGLIEDAGSQIF